MFDDEAKILDFFRLYVGIKLHFTNEKYDFFKYKGKNLNTNISTVKKRNDYRIFCSLTNKYNKIEFIELLLSNILNNNTLYIGELHFNTETENVFNAWKKKSINIYQTIESEVNDVAILLESNDKDMTYLFNLKNCDYSPIFRMLRQDRISNETYIAHQMCFRFMDKFDKKYNDDIIVNRTHLTIRKYMPFLSLDRNRLISIFKEHYFKGRN